MRKNFLLVFLLGLLPLAMWAAPTTPKTPATLASSLTYIKDTPQPLLTAELVLPDDYDTTVGEVFYLALTTDGTPTPESKKWSKSIPTGENADKYRVWYKITSDGTYDYEQSIQKIGDVTIAPKPLEADKEFTAPAAFSPLHKFTNAAQDIVNEGTVDASIGKFEYRMRTSNWGSWSAWSEDIPQATNRINSTNNNYLYQIEYRIAVSNTNYTWSGTPRIYTNLARATWVVGDVLGEEVNGEKVNLVLPKSSDAVFDGTPQILLIEAKNSLGADNEYQNTYGWAVNDLNYDAFKATNVAQNGYTRRFRIQQNTNWEKYPSSGDYATISCNLVPAKAPAATGGELYGPTLTYTGGDQDLVKTPYSVTIAGTGSATLHYYVKGEDKGTAIAGVQAKEFGSYDVTYGLVYSGNALLNYKPVDPADALLGTVSIGKAKLYASSAPYSKKYDGTEVTDQTLFYGAKGWVAGEDEAKQKVILAELLEVEGLPKKDAGVYTLNVKTKSAPDANYEIEWVVTEPAQLTIEKADNEWIQDVYFDPSNTWAYGATMATAKCEPRFTEGADITYKFYKDLACTEEIELSTSTDAGTYYAKAFVSETKNFEALESTTPAEFTIDPSAPDWTTLLGTTGLGADGGKGWEYTKYSATENAPLAVVDDGAEVTYNYYEDAGCTTEIPVANLPELGVGTYYVQATAAATANHTKLVSSAVPFKVTPTELPATGIADVESPYDATNQNPGADAINAAILAKTGLVVGTDYELSFEPSDKFINVGEYYVIATGKGNYAKEVGDPLAVNTQKVKYTITQADVPLEDIIAAKAEFLTYDNTDQVLAKEASIKDGSILVGTFEYSLSNEGPWTPTVPTGFNAGDYKVYTKFTPSTNFKDNVEVTSIDAKIEQAQLKITLTNTLEKDWDGVEFSADEVAETYVIDGLQGDDAYVVPFTLALPATKENNFIDAKEYELKKLNVTWKDENVKNYKIAFTTVGSVTINKADIADTDFDAPSAAPDLIFNGDLQDLVTPGQVITKYNDKPIGTILYATAKDGEYTENIPQGKDAADDYSVWYYVQGDANHNDTDPVEITNTIAPKPWTAVLAGLDALAEDELIYNGKDFLTGVDLGIKDGEDAEKALVKGTDYEFSITNGAGDEVTELIDVDTYTFTYTGINNYDGSTATATITINPAELNKDMLSEYSESLKYDMTDQNPNITLTYEGMTLVADKDFEAAVPAEFINAGTYEWTYTGIGNYTGTVPVKIVIAQLPAQAVAKSTGKIYDGIAGLSGTEVEFTYTGLLKGEAADAIVFTGDVVTNADEFLNVGEYVMEFDPTKFSSTNYNVVGVEKNGATFTVTPATLTVGWNEDAQFVKEYGDVDPEFIATAENLVVVGAVNADEEAAIIAQTIISRVEGDDEAAGLHDLVLSADPEADPSIFANYDVTFAPASEALAIGSAPIYVSIAPQSKIYDGKAVEDFQATAEMLVITDWKGDDVKADVFEVYPTFTVTDSKAPAGEYELVVKDKGTAKADYIVEFLPSTYVIKPKVTIETLTMKIGQDVDEFIAALENPFTIEGIADEDQAAFALDVNAEYIDPDAKIVAEAGTYDDGLVIICNNDEIAAKYKGFDETTGILVVVPAEAIVLSDDDTFMNDIKKEGVSVTFTDRNINAGTWNVCALPFATTPKQISDAFGFAAVDILNENSNDVDVHFTVVSSGTIPAYTPFLVKTTSDEDLVKTNFNQVIFNNVDIEEWDGANKAVKDLAGNQFIGTFQKETTFTGGEYLYMSKGDWYDASKRSVTLKPFRAYVQLVNPKARIFIEEPDGTVTAIDAVRFNEEINAEGMFNLNGVKVNNINRKGVYIKNGVKVIK